MKWLFVMVCLSICAWFFIKIKLSIKYVKNSIEDLLIIKVFIFNLQLYEKNFSSYMEKIFLKKLKRHQTLLDKENASKKKNWSEIKNIVNTSLYKTQNAKSFGDFKYKLGFKKGNIKICYSCDDPALTSITYGVLNSVVYTCLIPKSKYLNVDIQPNFIAQQLFIDAECIFTFTFGDFIYMLRKFRQEAKK